MKRKLYSDRQEEMEERDPIYRKRKFRIILFLSIIALLGAIQLNAQQPACSTAVVVSNFEAIPCSTGVKYQFNYNNPTGVIASTKIRLGSGSNACDSVCISLPANSTGQLITPCMPTCDVFDTLFVYKYPIAGCSCPSVLPINFISFNADKNSSGGVKLMWEAEVINEPSSHFKVEKSQDGTTFTTIALVFSDESIKKYFYTDPNPGNGKVFYRIVFTNNSGTKKYTNVQLVSFEKNVEVKAFLDGIGTLRIQGLPPDELANILVIDFSGRILKKAQMQTEQILSTGIQVSSLATGIYVVNVTTQTKTYSAKFFKN
jgi:hypothetical protein